MANPTEAQNLVVHNLLVDAIRERTTDTGFEPQVTVRCGEGKIAVHLKVLPPNMKIFSVNLIGDPVSVSAVTIP